MTKCNDIVGRRFGRLVVIEFLGLRPYGKSGVNRSSVLCKCDCGNDYTAYVSSLTTNAVLSCGCRRKENQIKSVTKHGMFKSRLYVCWGNMKARCTNKNNKDYPNYGGRGISVCSEWLDFGKFKDWALANGYNDSLVIDRIDNDRGYEPDNCRWITNEQNQNNRRKTFNITAFGITLSAGQWAKQDICKVDRGTLRHRIRAGMNPEEAITTPLFGCRK